MCYIVCSITLNIAVCDNDCKSTLNIAVCYSVCTIRLNIKVSDNDFTLTLKISVCDNVCTITQTWKTARAYLTEDLSQVVEECGEFIKPKVWKPISWRVSTTKTEFQALFSLFFINDAFII